MSKYSTNRMDTVIPVVLKMNGKQFIFNGTTHGGLYVTGKTLPEALRKVQAALDVLIELKLVGEGAKLQFEDGVLP